MEYANKYLKQLHRHDDDDYDDDSDTWAAMMLLLLLIGLVMKLSLVVLSPACSRNSFCHRPLLFVFNSNENSALIKCMHIYFN